MRWCFYVDMDAFYVACELRERPELRGKPVVVGPNPREGPSRGVVLSASYEARAFGLHSALPVGRAHALCPNAVWIAPDFEKYERSAEAVRALLREFSADLVAFSIDEAALYIDVSGAEEAEKLAREIQGLVARRLDLPCSIGVASHRTIAKIASDRAKPGGVAVVAPEAIVAFLADLPVRAIPGVGPKTQAILEGLEVRTIGDLRHAGRLRLRRRLGVFADELLQLAEGRPREPEKPESAEPRSRSSEKTFDEDTSQSERLLATVQELAQETAHALTREGYRYQSVTVRVRWEDFSQLQRGRMLAAAREGPEALTSVARRLAEEIFRTEREGRNRKTRLLSVQAGRLAPVSGRQERLDRFLRRPAKR